VSQLIQFSFFPLGFLETDFPQFSSPSPLSPASSSWHLHPVSSSFSHRVQQAED